jgi:hypothetical protein
MRVTLALLADGANVSREGKLNILGVFDTLFARTFPTTHAQMQLVIRFEAETREEVATPRLEVQFVSEDDHVLFRLPGTMTVGQGPRGGTVRLEHILTLTNLQLDAPGRYRFHIVVDGETLATVPLLVEQIGVAH